MATRPSGALARPVYVGVLAALQLTAAGRLAAQTGDTASTAASDSAAERVHGARIAPSPLHLSVGDTVTVEVTLLDEKGQPVVVPLPSGAVAPPRYYLVSSGFMFVDALGNVSFGGTDRPSATMRLVGHIPSESAKVMVPVGGAGHRTFRNFEVPITVGERATGRIEIQRPSYVAYVGTSIPLTATVWKRGAQYPDAAPDISWASTDPGTATIASDGTVSFRHAGAATIIARNGGARASVHFVVRRAPAARLTLEADRTDVRTGDVVHLAAWAMDSAGAEIRGARFNLAVSGDNPASGRAGAATYDGRAFVAEEPGVYTVVAELGNAAAAVTITARPRGLGAKVEVLAHVPALHDLASEVMVFEGRDGRDYAYLGYLGQEGNRLHCFDVTDPSHPVLRDSVLTDAHSINDVRVDKDRGATIGVFTKEGSSDRKNGIVLLDLTNPAHPTKFSEFTATTIGGVHNAWIAGSRVYLANDGTGDLHIVDISDPRHPKESGRWSVGTPGHYLHDMVVQDGIAYLAYWDDGMIILDVGGAGKGGTPDRPVFVSRYTYGPGGHTHHVFRYKQYVFVGDEGSTFIPHPANGPSGYVHVVDVSNLERPREVAKYYIPEAGSHNSWVEHDTMYTAYYQGGLRVVDVSGDLRGDLYQQGRQIAWFDTGAPVGEAYVPNRPFGAAPQYYKGNVFFADFYSGFWIFKLTPASTAASP